MLKKAQNPNIEIRNPKNSKLAPPMAGSKFKILCLSTELISPFIIF